MILKNRGNIFLPALFFLLSFFFINAQSTTPPEQPSPPPTKRQYIHHELKVELNPAQSRIEVFDTIHFPPIPRGKKIHFILHSNLELFSVPQDIEIKKESSELKPEYFGINTASFPIKTKIPITHYSIRFLTPSPGQSSITLGYRGHIHHPVEQITNEYARGFGETPGIIDAQGVYLAGSTYWVPWFNDQPVTFRLQSTLPANWLTVSQGNLSLPPREKQKTPNISVWDCPEPMEEIFLITAPFHFYSQDVGKIKVMAFLRTPDDALANKYLETTGQYLEMYETLIGPYPYAKFALIENFWETGYGMPSFTLLGSQVIRFPFILHSSYPHELLHNWWGNSVLVNYQQGNWCEGLTTYLADHLVAEQRGQGEDYRKTALQKYTHYAAGKKNEFPLNQFTARQDSLSSAIGYDKSMMLFHMLRQYVGEAAFIKAISLFYKNNQYKAATFDDLLHAFQNVNNNNLNGIEQKIDLKDFFHQWVNRTGAPVLRVTEATVTNVLKNHPDANPGQYQLKFFLEQVQADDPYHLSIPAAIYLEGETTPVMKTLIMNDKNKRQAFTFTFNHPVQTLHIDPQFDVFRLLHENEIPPTLSAAFGTEKVLILLPSLAPVNFQNAYRQLAETWAGENQTGSEIKMDNQVTQLPSDRAIWLLGHENLHKRILQTGISFYGSQTSDNSLVIQDKNLPYSGYSITVAVKNPRDSRHVVILLSADRVDALPGLGRKLPHYGKYSYLAFEGNEPTNILKGQWPVVQSPLSVSFSSPHPSLTSTSKSNLPQRQPLARLTPLFSSQRMMEDIRYLASDQLEGRGLGYKGLEKSAHYIAVAYKKAGLQPAGDSHSYFQTWEAEVGPAKRKVTLRNVIGIIPGTHPEWTNQAVVVCAHYDHLGYEQPGIHENNKGKIHPGADDNASGIAVLLELARTMGNSMKPGRTMRTMRTIIFIAFTGEESNRLGSRFYIKNLSQQSLNHITAAINLDTVGRLENKKLMVIGSSSAREWRFIFMGIQYTLGIESELLTQDLDSSDQTSFHEAGIPAIQLFSGAHLDYHQPTDTPDKIDSPGLVKVAAVAREALLYLCERNEPLTITLNSTATIPATTPTSHPSSTPTDQRKVSIGIMPDFSFNGPGVKIAAVAPGSPAEKAGLLKDDIIIQVMNTTVNNLKEYADLLKKYKPGDQISLIYLRNGNRTSISIPLVARQ